MIDRGVQLILLGDEPGVGEFAKELGVDRVPTVQRNEFGTPLVNDVFLQAEILAHHSVMCYINADIILMSDFCEAIRAVESLRRHFLMGGRPWNVDIRSEIEFSPRWEERLRDETFQADDLRGYGACDYFAYRKGLWSSLPPFAVGRRGVDNALLYRARASGAALIDATPSVVAVHQNHPYAAAVGGANAGTNPEALRNIALAGGWTALNDLRNATHVIASGQLKRRWIGTVDRRSMRTREITLTSLWQRWVYFPIVDVTRPLRRRLGWRRSASRSTGPAMPSERGEER